MDPYTLDPDPACFANSDPGFGFRFLATKIFKVAICFFDEEFPSFMRGVIIVFQVQGLEIQLNPDLDPKNRGISVMK